MKQLVNDIIARLTTELLPCSDNKQTAKTEGWWLLEALTHQTQAELIRQEEIMLTMEQIQKLEQWVQDRVEYHKPLQYILGTVPFCELEILVAQPVLIPRPETEEWCAWLIKQFEPVKNKPINILDLGAGSGCIALALAHALPKATVLGVDIHPDAIALCKKNKTHNKISNASFIQSDLYQALSPDKKFDLIVSNPPYISEKEFTALSKDVTEWEDKSALVAEEDGFAIHKKIISHAPLFLKEKSELKQQSLPRLVLEHGKGQAEEVKKLLEQAGLKTIELHKDLEGVHRWITAQL